MTEITRCTQIRPFFPKNQKVGRDQADRDRLGERNCSRVAGKGKMRTSGLKGVNKPRRKIGCPRVRGGGGGSGVWGESCLTK